MLHGIVTRRTKAVDVAGCRRAIAAMQDLGVALGDEGEDVVSLAKERRFAVRASKQGLERLRAHGGAKQAAEQTEEAAELAEELAGQIAELAGQPAVPGQALADYVVETADASDDDEPGEVRPERVFVPGAKDAIALPHGSSELYLMTRLRDEAHRFAITHHRKRRGKRSLVSALDGIKGVGPATKRALIKHFGSVKAIKAASVEQLCEVKGVGPKLAETIHAGL